MTYYQLKHKKDRLSYLRALAIGTLINEATKVFLENEEAILNGDYPYSLLEKCKYEAQINDIIKLSVEKNIPKEIVAEYLNVKEKLKNQQLDFLKESKYVRLTKRYFPFYDNSHRHVL